MLSEKKIISNWNIFLKNIENHITGKRKEKLLAFYNSQDERFSLMPASTKTSYHNAFPGGHVDHTNRVLTSAFLLKDIWEQQGAIIDFSDEELAFVAINHDLGKFGDEENELFIDQESDWHRKRGEIYKNNPAVSFMKVPERSLFILQSLGIKVTKNEYYGIRLHDGLFEESNKSYFMAYSEEYKLRSNLPYIISQADLMSARIESNLQTK